MSRPAAIRASLAALAIAACLGACGESDDAAAPPAPPPDPLPAAAVPYLDSRDRTLSPVAIAKETGLPRLERQLADWGYEAGASRYFQGQSRRLQVVDSRAYRFRSPAGAAALMRAIRTDPRAFFAGAGEQRTFAVAGFRGIAIDGLPCACHLAQPARFAAVRDGATVRTLEINGARATPRALRTLAARAL
jgi:hypothetical protein